MNPLMSIDLAALHQADLAAEAAQSRLALGPDRPERRTARALPRRLAALVAIAAVRIHPTRPIRG